MTNGPAAVPQSTREPAREVPSSRTGQTRACGR